MTAKLEEVIMSTCDLPTIPSVAGRVIQLVSDPNISAEKLSEAIIVDQNLVARVLKIANSASYGCLRNVSSLNQAVTILGFSTLKNIVLAASIKGVHKRFGLAEKMLQEHSLGTAMTAHYFAKETSFKNQEEVFLAGLLHDIGKVVLNNNVPDKFSMVMEEVYNTGCTFTEMEKDVFGFTHAEVGRLVVKKWNLSQELEEVIRFHHEPERADKNDPYVFQLTSIVNLADAMCHNLGIGLKEPEDIDFTKLKSFSILRQSIESLERIEKKVEETFTSERSLFE